MKVVLVGNSSALLGRGLGARIDACDRIVRINSFRIAGFEAHVGSRIDIVGMGRLATVSGQDPLNIRAACEVWMKRPWSYARWDAGTRQAITHFGIPEDKLRYPSDDLYWCLAERLVRMTNERRRWWRAPYAPERRPGRWSALMRRWRPADRGADIGRSARAGVRWLSLGGWTRPSRLVPSTGAVMIEMALDFFKSADVHVVGFDQLRGGHYWEAGARPLPVHPWDAERRLLDVRLREGVLRWLD